AFLGLEANQHRDRNGDGDQNDKVVEVWTAGSGITNLGLAGTSETFAAYDALPDGGLAFVVPEADQGGRDLNGDGDSADWVIHLWRPGAGVKNLGLAVHFPGDYMASFAGDGLAVMVREADQGGRDLNGDGDTSDRVVELWTPSGGTRNVGIATSAGGFAVIGGGGVAFRAVEADQGHTDLDHDGDTAGAVLFVARPDGTIRNTGVDVVGFTPADGGRLVYLAQEGPGRDLNGDGDTMDQVVAGYDPAVDVIVNSGLAVTDQLGVDLGGGRFAVVVAERDDNPGGAPGADLNGDGDTTDGVVELITAFGPPPTTSSEGGGLTGGPGAPQPPTGPAVPGGDSGGSGPAPPRSAPGYWMLGADGRVYSFGAAPALGNTASGAVDVEPTPSGRGYWVMARTGAVSAFGDAPALGNVDTARLTAGEETASLSATPTGKGYWIFTNRGRAVPFGDAPFLGDMSQTKLNGPVLGSVATPTGKGYYMVASDGGIFAFGDAAFAGSMGGKKLNASMQSLVPDSDGKGYWLVASDGGIFAFDAPFKGSLGGIKLNKPIVGMVCYGDGYLMVGADGGIFNFSSSPFAGSLGDQPPASPVVAVAALPLR